jgi:hypothetical protein
MPSLFIPTPYTTSGVTVKTVLLPDTDRVFLEASSFGGAGGNANGTAGGGGGGAGAFFNDWIYCVPFSLMKITHNGQFGTQIDYFVPTLVGTGIFGYSIILPKGVNGQNASAGVPGNGGFSGLGVIDTSLTSFTSVATNAQNAMKARNDSAFATSGYGGRIAPAGGIALFTRSFDISSLAQDIDLSTARPIEYLFLSDGNNYTDNGGVGGTAQFPGYGYGGHGGGLATGGSGTVGGGAFARISWDS